MFTYIFNTKASDKNSCKSTNFFCHKNVLPLPYGQDAVQKTADHYRLAADDSVLVGGGAFALHGIDTYVHTSDSKFDLDAIDLKPPHWSRRVLGGLVTGQLRLDILDTSADYTDPEAPLRLSTFGGPIAETVASGFFRYNNLDDLVKHKVQVGNLATVPVNKLVYGKLSGAEDGRVKDEAGLIKAHVIAASTGHEVINDPYWKKAIGTLVAWTVERPAPRRGKRPEWMIELIDSGFDHPAFEGIHKGRK